MPPARTRTTCFTCDELLPMFGSYGKQRHYCSRECFNLHRVCTKYKITPSDYRQMLTNQNDCCAACNDPLDRPHVDHCHTTGKARAILCGPCNIALGHAKESPDRLRKIAAYVERGFTHPQTCEGCNRPTGTTSNPYNRTLCSLCLRLARLTITNPPTEPDDRDAEDVSGCESSHAHARELSEAA